MADTHILPRTELEELQQQVGEVTNASLESTRRMLYMVEDSEEVGRRTIESLDIQGKQLDHIEQGMDNLNANMTKTEKTLTRMKRCCNICPMPWNRVPTEDEDDIKLKNINYSKGKIIREQPRGVSGDRDMKSVDTAQSQSGYIKPITNDDREKEMNSNMCQVDSILGNLCNMAMDMNAELEKQNNQLGVINEKGDNSNIRLAEVNKSANTLLKS